MKLNKKGFALSTLIYGCVIFFSLVFIALIFILRARFNKSSISKKLSEDRLSNTNTELKNRYEINDTVISSSYTAPYTGTYYIGGKTSDTIDDDYKCKVDLNSGDKLTVFQEENKTFLYKDSSKICSVDFTNKTIVVYYLLSSETITTDSLTSTFTENKVLNCSSISGSISNISVIKQEGRNFLLSWSVPAEHNYSRFVIQMYINNNLVSTKYVNANSSTTDYELKYYTTNYISEASFSPTIEIYGIDESNKDQCLSKNSYSLTLNDEISLISTYSVSINSGNFTSSGVPTTIKEGQNLSFTITPNSNYSISGVSIKDYYGNTLTYSQSGTSYTVDSSQITSNITITVSTKSTSSSGGCLAGGTKILLADGTSKNIEDIDYNDLLTVIDYKNGGISYQYPIWIEKELTADNYTLITFSDDTKIKVVYDHAFFSYDDNEFVVVSDKEKFHIGTRVAKLTGNKLDEVTVKNIEYINEKVNYYHVMSSKYYNIIANNVVTTDDVLFITNMYGFNNNITWRDSVTNDLYTKEELYVIPDYIYYGSRAADGKYLTKFGIDYDLLIYYFKTNTLNEVIWRKPELNENGKREWMVTTSEDEVTEENKLSYLMEEGDYYTLKFAKNINGKKFIGWLHTGENTLHQPGDKVEVLYGTHFIAKYQDLFDNANKSNKLNQ